MTAHLNSLTIRISVPSCKLRYLVFITYNLLYVLYMEGYAPQSLYLATLAMFCIMNALTIYAKAQNSFTATRELKLGLGYVLAFLFISILIQIIHQDFGIYLYQDIFRITLPIINAFFFVNSINEKDREFFFTVLYLRFILHCFFMNVC